MQTVLITGINGFVGQYLAEELLAKGYKVVGVGRGESRIEFSHTDFIYESLDFTDKEAIVSVCYKYRPSVVVHCGALSKPDECELDRSKAYKINVEGTNNLLEAAALQQSFFLFISTDFVFSGEEGFYKEEDDRAPVNYYGETKRMAEDNVKQYEYDWAIARTILVYGKPKGGKSNIMTMVAENLSQGKPLRMFEDQVRTPTYVGDLVNGLTALIEKKATGIFHISGKDRISIYNIAIEVADLLGFNKSLISAVTESTFQQPARRPPKTAFDLQKAETVLGYQPISFKEGLRKTFAQ